MNTIPIRTKKQNQLLEAMYKKWTGIEVKDPEMLAQFTEDYFEVVKHSFLLTSAFDHSFREADIDEEVVDYVDGCYNEYWEGNEPEGKLINVLVVR